MTGDFSAWHTSARIARIARRRAPHRIPRQSLGSQLPGVLRNGLPGRSQVPAIGTAVRFRSIVRPAISRMTKRQAPATRTDRVGHAYDVANTLSFRAHRQDGGALLEQAGRAGLMMPRYEAFSSRTLKGRAFSLNGNQVPAYCTRALTLAGGTCRVAHAPFDARCVVAGGPPTIENVAHTQFDSQEKVLRLVRQFFPMRVRALAGSAFRDTSSFEPSVRSRIGEAREHTMPHALHTACDEDAPRGACRALAAGLCHQGPCARGRSLQESVTDRLWKEFVARSVPKPHKLNQSPAVEGVELSGPFSAAFRVAQTMSQRYVHEISHYRS